METDLKQRTLSELTHLFFIEAAKCVSVRLDLTRDEKDSLITEIAEQAEETRKLCLKIEEDDMN